MDEITLERSERIKMFFNEYYFGVSIFHRIFRMIGGPIIFYIGIIMYSNAMDRFGIGYGGMMIAYSIYFTLKPFWWSLIKWEYYKTVDFQLEATNDRLIIKEGDSESKTEYSKFEKIIKRKKYFSLRLQKGMKIYLPLDKLSEKTINTLTQNIKN